MKRIVHWIINNKTYFIGIVTIILMAAGLMITYMQNQKEEPKIVISVGTEKPYYTFGERKEKISAIEVDNFFVKFYTVLMADIIKDELIKNNIITLRTLDIIERTSSMQIAKVATLQIHIPYKILISNNGRLQTTLLNVKGNLYTGNSEFYSGDIGDLRLLVVKPGEVKEYKNVIDLNSKYTLPFLKGLLKKAIIKIFKIDDNSDDYAMRNSEELKQYIDKTLENEFKILSPHLEDSVALRFELEITDQHGNINVGSIDIDY